MTYSKVGDPAGWDVSALIDAIVDLDDARRTGALAVFTHHLTVEMRVALGESFPHPGMDQIRQLNEFLHHLTSRLHPADRRTAEDDKSLLEAFFADAARVGLGKGIRRGLVIAVRNAFAEAKQPLPAL